MKYLKMLESTGKTRDCDLREMVVWFYDISTLTHYLMPNPIYTYILNIYDL